MGAPQSIKFCVITNFVCLAAEFESVVGTTTSLFDLNVTNQKMGLGAVVTAVPVCKCYPQVNDMARSNFMVQVGHTHDSHHRSTFLEPWLLLTRVLHTRQL